MAIIKVADKPTLDYIKEVSGKICMNGAKEDSLNTAKKEILENMLDIEKIKEFAEGCLPSGDVRMLTYYSGENIVGGYDNYVEIFSVVGSGYIEELIVMSTYVNDSWVSGLRLEIDGQIFYVDNSTLVKQTNSGLAGKGIVAIGNMKDYSSILLMSNYFDKTIYSNETVKETKTIIIPSEDDRGKGIVVLPRPLRYNKSFKVSIWQIREQQAQKAAVLYCPNRD